MVRVTCGVVAGVMLAAGANAQMCSVNELQKLLPDGNQSFANFGESVATAGDVIVVGRPNRDVDSPMFISSPGSAEVFELIGGTWQRTATLRADPAVAQAMFGNSVETDGTIVVVGSSFEDFADGGPVLSQAGAVYIFEKIGGVWTQTQRLTSNEPETAGHFGESLDLEPGALVIGEELADYDPDADSEAGAVHLFNRTGNSFSHSVKLQVPEASFRAHLGNAVAIENSIIYASARKENGGGNEAGAVYIFGFDTTWSVIGKLQAPVPRTRGEFGWSLDVNNGSVAVGGLDYFFGTGQGSVFTFEPNGMSGWDLSQQFNGTSTLNADSFGFSTHFVDHDTLLVSATLDDDGGPQTGSVFVFKRIGGVWTQDGSPFGNADRAAGDMFGSDLDSDGTRFISSALFNDDGVPQNGSVHVFDLICAVPCPGDIADTFGSIGEDGMIDFGDFLALLGLVGPCPGMTPGCTGDIADGFGTLNGGDGTVDFGDFLAQLGLVGPCP